MSQLLQTLAKDGLTFVPDSKAPEGWVNGIPYVGTDLAVDPASPIDSYHMGLPITITGRLCTSLDQPVVRYGSGAAPFDAAGRLCLSEAAVVTYLGGVGYTANGQVAGTAVPPAGGDFDNEQISIYVLSFENSSPGNNAQGEAYIVPPTNTLMRISNADFFNFPNFTLFQQLRDSPRKEIEFQDGTTVEITDAEQNGGQSGRFFMTFAEAVTPAAGNQGFTFRWDNP